MNVLKLNSIELKAILEIIDAEIESLEIALDEKLITVQIHDDLAEFVSENIKDKLVATGFGENYKLNEEGEKLQNLLDKFIAIGW